MAHGVKLEVADCDPFHFAIGRMVVDPVLVAAEAIPGIQNRRVLVGDPGQFIEPPARQRAEAMEMRLQPAKITRLKIQREKIAQAAIDFVEILPRAIRRDVIGAARDTPCFSVAERFSAARASFPPPRRAGRRPAG